MKRFIFLLLDIVLLYGGVSAQHKYVLFSPDSLVSVELTIANDISWSLLRKNTVELANSKIGLELSDGYILGNTPIVDNVCYNTCDTIYEAFIYKKKRIVDIYNELVVDFADDFSLVFRAYNEGIAYRIIANRKENFKVKNEKAIFNFLTDKKAYFPYVSSIRFPFSENYNNSFENTYHYCNISDFDNRRLAFLPVVIESQTSRKICITEADLFNYPGMFLYNSNNSLSLAGHFAPYPDEIVQGGHNNLQGVVQTRHNYIAECESKTSFPWRIISIVDNDYELLDNDLVYKLSTPCKLGDISWIKPGKVAWDWWNDWNIYGVNFKSGINTLTYKYYIDFASKNGIEYVLLDEGWSVNGKADLMQIVPQLDLKELIDYANDRDVGLLLWAGYYAFDRDMENICKHYSQMGIKGFKVDFMDRDDQLMVDFHYRAAEMAAKYKLLIDFHGTYKPTGLQRTFPNVLNFEGVYGLEQMKWRKETLDSINLTNNDMVKYDVTFPYIRMFAGPVDYTQGAMRNASRENYRPINSETMSQGTRCRQLAEYVIFDSPLSMLCDSPSNYEREQECVDFITDIPTVWEKTIAIDGKLGEYIVMAREALGCWYIGAITSWTPRHLEITLPFIDDGTYLVELYRDGMNAHRAGRDYIKEYVTIKKGQNLKIDMAPGGGYVAKIVKKYNKNLYENTN